MVETINTSGEKIVEAIQNLPEKMATFGYIKPETLEEIETTISTEIEDKTKIEKLNRSQRRAIARKMGKRGRGQMDTISETAKKLNYIDLLQKLRKLNEEKEKENDGSTAEN